MTPPTSAPPKRIRIGSVPIDVVDFAGALDRIDQLVHAGEGGTVFTPNVDHVVMAASDRRLSSAYEQVSLSLVDGMPVLWASRILGSPLPEKVSGSDLVVPLMELAARRRYRVFFLGGAAGAAERAAEVLRARFPSLEIVGTDASRISVDVDEDQDQGDHVPPPRPHHQQAPSGATNPVVARIAAARPHLVLLALGAPKQEIWAERYRDALRPAVLVAVGAGLDFVAGMVRRAPPWVSRAGLEWLFRLAQEPRRLAGRYLLRDPKFALIVARDVLERRRRAPSSRSSYFSA